MGANVDDFAATCVDHMGIHRPGAEEDPSKIDVHDLLPFRKRIVLRRVAYADASIVDQNVHVPEGARRCLNHRLHRGFILHIGAEPHGLDTECLERSDSLRRLVLIAGRNHDGGSRSGQAFGNTEADTAIAAGDDGDFPLQMKDILGHHESPNDIQGTSDELCTSLRHRTLYSTDRIRQAPLLSGLLRS
jgi:hypothetical protein